MCTIHSYSKISYQSQRSVYFLSSGMPTMTKVLALHFLLHVLILYNLSLLEFHNVYNVHDGYVQS